MNNARLLKSLALTALAMILIPLSTMAKKPDSAYEYVLTVFERLQSHWEQQALDSRLNDSLLTFVLNEDGTLNASNLQTAQDDNGSGEQALEFVRQNAPFGAFPSSLRGSQLEFKFKLTPGSLQMLSYNILPKQKDNPSPIVFGAGLDRLAGPPTNDPNATWGQPGVMTADEELMNEYIDEVQTQIRNQWQWTGPQPGNRAVALLAIDRNGYLMSAIIRQSSGIGALDKAALKAIYLASPFRPVPMAFRSMPLEIEYVFEPAASATPATTGELIQE